MYVIGDKLYVYIIYFVYTFILYLLEFPFTFTW